MKTSGFLQSRGSLLLSTLLFTTLIVPLSAVGFMSVQNYAKAVKVAKESNKNEAFARIPLQIKSLERFKSCAKTPTGMEQCSNEVAQLEGQDTNDSSWCDFITDTDSKESCRRNIFYNKHYENACKNLSNVGMRKSCQADIMSEQAARMHDINLCKNIQLDDQARTDRYQERCRTKAIKILDH